MRDSTPSEADKSLDKPAEENKSESDSKPNEEKTAKALDEALDASNKPVVDVESTKDKEVLKEDSKSTDEVTADSPNKGDKENKDENPSEENAKINDSVSKNNEAKENERITRGKKRKLEDSKEVIESENETQESGNISKELDDLSKDDSHETHDLSMSNKTEPMGKGKRARIPNKRYGEISLSANNRKSVDHSSALTDGNVTAPDEIQQEEVQIKEEVLSYASEDLASISSKKNKATPAPNLSDPKYFKPFDFGWKRELVWRSTSSNSKRQGDIYYYTPTGKKVRSFREVSENLSKANKKLTLDNFTFFKESLGINDPSKEIVRDAKFKVIGMTPSPKVTPKKLPQKRLSHLSSTPKPSPKATTPSATPIKTKTAQKTPINKNNKIKIAMRSNKKPTKTPPTPMEVDKPVAKSTPVRKPTKVTNLSGSSNDGKPCQPCSIRCEGVQGIIPTLQCRICLCLYHHECVGLSPHLNLPYICKNCHLEQTVGQAATTTTISAPPPLTPINTLKSVTPSNLTTLPKLQRIPRSNLPELPPLVTPPELPVLPRLTPRPPQVVTPPQENFPTIQSVPPVPTTPPIFSEPQKSLVGGVTSWLPHNSKIVEESTDVPRPQYLEILGGRKFLVIPKHNLMTISPNIANKTEENVAAVPETIAPSTSVPVDSASLGPSPHSSDTEVKNIPESPKPKPNPDQAVLLGNVEESQTVEAMDVDPTAEIDAGTSSTGVKRPALNENNEQLTVPAVSKPKTRNLKLSNLTNSVVPEERSETRFMENYLQNLSFGYNTLLYVFQYLKVQDLLRAGCVCTMWRDIASHPILWRTVRMKNSQVHSFEGLANTLKKHGTRHLDLRKMLLPSAGDEIWPEFSKAISRVDTLLKIELCRCPASVVEQLAVSNPNLEVINAVTIRCESMNLDPLKSLRGIKELRLKSTSGLTVSSIDSLESLTTLQQLSLTSVNELHKLNLNVLENLVNLKVLELGECVDFPKSFGENILVKLTKLEKLRLEKGQGNCHTIEILTAVKDMKNLEQLELVNFDVKNGFDKTLGACYNIKKLMIIPTYISQSATTNNMVLSGVLRLQKSLTHFVWGVTLELLRVTELFVDQCEEPKEKKERKPSGNGDSIPVLKPVPDLTNSTHIAQASNPPQVEILPLPNLQKLLLNSLPTTRVKILKIPFHATWRQTLTDSV